MTINVSDIMKIVEEMAPLRLAEKWDNCGLQAGETDWPVKKILVALDPLEKVVDYACSIDADLLITHHPLIFKPLSSLDFSTPVGKIIQKTIRNKLAIYSAHTNFDSAANGLNDILAERIGLREIKLLNKISSEGRRCKLVFYVPTEYKKSVLEALFETTAGIIGDYTCCSFLSDGKGTFKPGEASTPFIGETFKIQSVDETRIETIVHKEDIETIVEHIRQYHPYETMAYDVFPLIDTELSSGLGRVGVLPEPSNLIDFAEKVKERLGLGHIKIAGNKDLIVEKVALCTGSGSSLIKDFFASGAQVYLSGDLHYHDARMVEEKGLGLVDAGHFASEILIAESLGKRLQGFCEKKNYDVEVIACTIEKDPFIIL